MANTPVATSNIGKSVIKGFETYATRLSDGRAKAYKDAVGILTIGWGHTGSEVHPDLIVTEEEAEELLTRDLAKTEQAIVDLVKTPINQNQFDALSSFVFNLGKGALANSTLLKQLNAGNIDAVTSEFGKWIYAGKGSQRKALDGLKRRRASEAALWIAPVGAAIQVSQSGDVSVHYDAPPEDSGGVAAAAGGTAKPLTKSRTLAGATATGLATAGIAAVGGGTKTGEAAQGAAQPSAPASATTEAPATSTTTEAQAPAPHPEAPTPPVSAPEAPPTPPAAPAPPVAPAPAQSAPPALQTSTGAPSQPTAPLTAGQVGHGLAFWVLVAIAILGLIVVVFARLDDQSAAEN